MTGSTSAQKPIALIIEDSQPVVEIIKQALELAEFEVDQVGDGRLALERLAVVTPALILLDLHLPHTSGEQILDVIQAEARFAETKIIVASADVPTASTLAHRVDFVLVKPFSFFELYNLAKQLRAA